MNNDTPIAFPEGPDVQEDLRGLFRGAIRFTLEAFLEEQLVEMIGAERYQRVTLPGGERPGWDDPFSSRGASERDEGGKLGPGQTTGPL